MAMEIFKLMGTVAINKDKALQDIKAIQGQAQKASTAMGGSFNKFSGYIEQHSAQIKKAGKMMTIFGGIATAAFALSVKSAANFEEQLANVSTMLDESAMKILPEYRRELQSLSVEFGESTQTLSKGLYDILSASIPPAEALGVLEVSARAAAAGITDTGVAADAITTILNSYGFSADQAGMVSDKLFAIVKEGKTTFAELAPSIGKVAATASISGLSFDDLGAAIATITRAGIRSEEAMTAINGVLRGFLSPTKEAIAAAKGFGLELNTNTLRTEGLTGVMDKLKDATAEQLAAIFPNIRGLKGMAAALGDVEGYARSYALMLNSAGLTEEAFAKQSDTLNFKLGQLKQMFNVIKVTIGTALMPAVEDITKKIMGVLTKVKEWTEANPKLTATMVKWAAGISGLMLVAGPLLIALPSLVSGVNLLIGVTPGLVAALGKIKIALAGVAGQTLLIGANIIIWSEVWREWQKIAGSVKTTTEDIEAAQANLLRVQEEAAKKFGVTLEVFQEWQKEGKAISEISEDVAAVLKKLGAEEAFKKLKEDAAELRSQLNYMKADLSTMKIGSEEWQILSQNIEETEEALTDLHQEMAELKLSEGIVENAKIIKTTVADIMLDIDLLVKGFELTGKSVQESVTHYGTLIEKLNAIDIILQTELMLLEKGTEEWSKKKGEIADNTKALNEINEALTRLTEPLEGLELIAAKMALLGDSTEDTKAKIELLNEKAVLLQQALDEAIPDTEAWWEAKIAFEGNQVAIDGLKGKLKELTEEEKEAVRLADLLADAYKSITDKIFELTHTPMEMAIRKLDQQKQAYLDLGVEIGIVNKWHDAEIAKLNESNIALDEHKDKLEEATVATEELGILGGESWEGFTTQIKRATAELSNFTKEGVAAAIAAIKMHFKPLLDTLVDDINRLTGVWKIMAEANLAALKESMYEQIEVIRYGYEEYLNVLESLGGATEDLADQTSDSGDSMVDSFEDITDAVEKTTLSLEDAEEAMKNLYTAALRGELSRLGAEFNYLNELYDQGEESVEGYNEQITSLQGRISVLNKQIAEAVPYSEEWYEAKTAILKCEEEIEKLIQLRDELTKKGAQGKTAIVNTDNSYPAYQRGGGIDNVLIRATAGEYLISKPMTDFIKRTGVITGGLVKAIAGGRPTPAPGMQRGGLVGLGASQEIKYNIGPIYVAGDGDVGKIRLAIKQALDESNLQILRSGSEVIPGVG